MPVAPNWAMPPPQPPTRTREACVPSLSSLLSLGRKRKIPKERLRGQLLSHPTPMAPTTWEPKVGCAGKSRGELASLSSGTHRVIANRKVDSGRSLRAEPCLPPLPTPPALEPSLPLACNTPSLPPGYLSLILLPCHPLQEGLPDVQGDLVALLLQLKFIKANVY